MITSYELAKRVLDLQDGFTPDDLKRAYRKLAHTHHPDKGGDPEKFKEINEAYKFLLTYSKPIAQPQIIYGGTFYGSSGTGGYSWKVYYF